MLENSGNRRSIKEKQENRGTGEQELIRIEEQENRKTGKQKKRRT